MKNRFLPVVLTGVLVMTALLVTAQQRGRMELEIVSVDPRTWTVVARELTSGRELRFEVPPESFEGKRFTAALGRARAGAPFAATGKQGVELGGMVAADSFEAPAGVRPGPPGPPLRRTGPPGPPPRPVPGQQEFEVVSVTRDFVVTARNVQTTAEIRIQVDPASFAGYRLQADMRPFRRDERFGLEAPNELPIEGCCTLLEGGL